MENPGDFFIRHYFAEEKLQRQHRLYIRLLASILTVFVFAVMQMYRSSLIESSIFALVSISIVFFIRFRSIRRAREREEALFNLLEVDPAVFDHPSRMEIALKAAQSGSFQTLLVSKTQRRNRGSDEKGFTSGKTASLLDSALERRDASLSDGNFDGLEGDLRPSELLVSEANVRYEQIARQRWKDSESNDQDLIEAGVERLGDLVRTDWFEKNAKDGAVEALMESKSDDEPV
ncbi:MAG: hypothetical protein DWC09_08520 [Candidatus Poseidoniales archaeon]|nr:MAG: hypothetical protein DWC09_08520 [Candidatus Poseidoniales archaeon]